MQNAIQNYITHQKPAFLGGDYKDWANHAYRTLVRSWETVFGWHVPFPENVPNGGDCPRAFGLDEDDPEGEGAKAWQAIAQALENQVGRMAPQAREEWVAMWGGYRDPMAEHKKKPAYL